MTVCNPESFPCMYCPFACDTRLNGLCDSHGISSGTFFGPQLEIEYVDALGFCSSNIDQPRVFNPPTVRETWDNKCPTLTIMLQLYAY